MRAFFTLGLLILLLCIFGCNEQLAEL